ncbi:MAG: hypothetical protein ACTS46_01770 [Candidatus Hodgkinia cicadicola]
MMVSAGSRRERNKALMLNQEMLRDRLRHVEAQVILGCSRRVRRKSLQSHPPLVLIRRISHWRLVAKGGDVLRFATRLNIQSEENLKLNAPPEVLNWFKDMRTRGRRGIDVNGRRRAPM